MYDHDISGQCGDGPSNLLEEILGVNATKYYDDEIVEVPTCRFKSSRTVVNIEESSASMSSLTESLPPSSFATTPSMSIEDIVDKVSWDDVKLVDLLKTDDNVGEMPASAGVGKSDLVSNLSHGVCDTLSKNLFKEESHEDIVELLDDDSDAVYDVPTPLKSADQRADLCIIDLIDDDDNDNTKAAASSVSKEVPTAQAQENKASREIIEIE